jgi:hypothetical protein
VENSLWKRLRTCRKTDYRMNGHWSKMKAIRLSAMKFFLKPSGLTHFTHAFTTMLPLLLVGEMKSWGKNFKRVVTKLGLVCAFCIISRTLKVLIKTGSTFKVPVFLFNCSFIDLKVVKITLSVHVQDRFLASRDYPGSSRFFRNVGVCVPNYTASHPIRP